jgi:hypothetical protein
MCSDGKAYNTKSKFWADSNRLYGSTYWSSNPAAGKYLNRPRAVTLERGKLVSVLVIDLEGYQQRTLTTCSR